MLAEIEVTKNETFQHSANYFQFDRYSPGTRKIENPQMHLERSLSASAKQSSKTSSGARALAARLAQTDSNKVTEPIRTEIVQRVYPFKEVRRHKEGEVTPAPSPRCVHDPVRQLPRRSSRKTWF
jgi:hypothetical protein